MMHRAIFLASILLPALSGLSLVAGCSASSSAESSEEPPGAEDADDAGSTTQTPKGDAGVADGDAGKRPPSIKSCQPAFEEACKPPIKFTNGDPYVRGKVFTNVIKDVEKVEQDIACIACSILYRDPSEIPKGKHPSTINIVLDDHGGVAQAGGDTIQFDLDYIYTFKSDSADVVEQEMRGVLQHETVHLYQNYGNGGTGEGLADLVRAQVGLYPKDRWRANEGTWKDAYTASGNFYSWLTGPSSFHAAHYADADGDFPYQLNKALGGKSGDDAYDAVSTLIKSTFGKSVDTLWDEYQKTAF